MKKKNKYRRLLPFYIIFILFINKFSIKFQYLKKFLFMMRRKTHYYNLTCDDNNIYVSPLIVWRENHYGCKIYKMALNIPHH